MFNVKDGDATRSVIIFCSGTVALNRLVTNPTYPGIVDDYRKTFARAKEIKADILLAPHPEMYKMPEKRAKIADGAPNPFVNPGEFNAYAATLEKAFEDALAKQTAALRKRRAELHQQTRCRPCERRDPYPGLLFVNLQMT